MERNWQRLVDDIEFNEEIAVAYVVDGLEITGCGRFNGFGRSIEGDGKYHWRILLTGWNGAGWSVRTKKITGIERALETA